MNNQSTKTSAAVAVYSLSHVHVFPTPQTGARQGFSGKNTGVGRHFLLQGIFLTQGSNARLLSPALGGRFFTTEPQGEPRSSGKTLQDATTGADPPEIQVSEPEVRCTPGDGPGSGQVHQL